MEQLIQVMTTVEEKEHGMDIAAALLEQRLAACIQITGPITSVYRWKEKVENAQEFLLFIKTRKNYYQKVEEAIRRLHPYDTPEILATDVIKASEPYAKWVVEETGS